MVVARELNFHSLKLYAKFQRESKAERKRKMQQKQMNERKETEETTTKKFIRKVHAEQNVHCAHNNNNISTKKIYSTCVQVKICIQQPARI